MSKYRTIDVWNERFGSSQIVSDYTGRKMEKSACGNPNSKFHPTLDHIRPLSDGGADVLENIEICNRTTNEEKGDCFPHWVTNGKRYLAKKIKGTSNGYEIYEMD